MMEFNFRPNRHGDLDPAGRLILALAASLALHFALIFGVQVRAARQAGKPLPVMEVRIERAAGGPSGAALLTGLSAPAITDKVAEPAHEKETVPPPVAPASPVAEQASPLLPALDIPLIEDPTWYPAKQVDRHPTALAQIEPDYPEQAAARGVEGSVVLLLLIDQAGAVKEASVADANPEGVFDDSALAAFRDARFAPAQKNGRAVKSRVLIRVTYELTKPDKPVVVQPPLQLQPAP
ncbi:MAG: energy transducer TonB [Sulfuricella sp.]|nr:energy transducer TonB [Sulfuricella sp.]